MTNAELLMILNNGRNYGMTYREIAGNPEDRGTGILLLRARRISTIKRYRAKDERGRDCWRYMITEFGKRRLAWYKEHRPEYVRDAERRIAARKEGNDHGKM